MTRKTEFFKRVYQKHLIGKDDKYCIVFSIRTAKETSKVELHPDAPTMEYQQHDQNSSCFRSLASDFFV